jgi:hypothetical protein
MVYFKCLACRTRLYGVGPAADLVGDLCPGCGSLLEPVGELGAVGGFRSIKAREARDGGDTRLAHEQIADCVEGFYFRRKAVLARARVDAQRWIDDCGSFHLDAAHRPAPEIHRMTAFRQGAQRRGP